MKRSLTAAFDAFDAACQEELDKLHPEPTLVPFHIEITDTGLKGHLDNVPFDVEVPSYSRQPIGHGLMQAHSAGCNMTVMLKEFGLIK